MDLPHLRELRRRAVMSQEQLAQRSGVARDTISKLENGQRRAYPKTVHKLAAALSVDPRVLVGGVEYLEESGEETSGTSSEKKEEKKRIGF
ncbi:helix-turn-helix domain-containing protein [Rubrobacter calidifluminis]|uniref:helix-turn-helix domain-containing protein n=1 Tax=Rubrobacter calidifluminis TaxID=1392640 RepID=UPI00236312D2|nr:helix-turn-helix transcriptional regulator [Rubrobacter calidifluminis]